jgi:hypothetical protein
MLFDANAIVSIDLISSAIAFHMHDYDPANNKLSRNAGQLADVLGTMIYLKQQNIAWTDLPPTVQVLLKQLP